MSDSLYEAQMLAAKYKAERDQARQEVERLKRDVDNRRVELCSCLGIDTGTGWSDAVAEMDKRLMPPGYEWPRFEDGEKADRGDEFIDGSDNVRRATSIEIIHEVCGDTIVNDALIHWSDNDHLDAMLVCMWQGERMKRPKPDPIGADGQPIREGDEVWDEHGDELVVLAVYGQDVHCRYAEYGDQICDNGTWEPSQLTHTKPEPPDSWERLEKDAENLRQTIDFWFEVFEFDDSGDDSVQTRLIDIVRRAKALAEGGSDEPL